MGFLRYSIHKNAVGRTDRGTEGQLENISIIKTGTDENMGNITKHLYKQKMTNKGLGLFFTEEYSRQIFRMCTIHSWGSL